MAYFAFGLALAGASLAFAQAAPQPEANSLAQLDAAAVAEFVGQYAYVDEPEIVLSVYREGSRLYAEGERSPREELVADSANRFQLRSVADAGKSGADQAPRAEVIFQRGSDGKVTGLQVAANGRARAAARISDQPRRNHFIPYDREEAMIPMRDGVKLHAVILRPAGSADPKAVPLPFLMQRTPYGVDGNTSDSVNERYTELAEGCGADSGFGIGKGSVTSEANSSGVCKQQGYIFVFEDIRGRYESEGKFVMNRPIVHKLGDRTDPKLVDESSDAYDTVAWLLKNIPNNNGRVGVAGISYPGFLAMMAGIDAHPAVKAVSPQAPMTDVWMGDDFFHNGAFRETYGYDYVLGMESSKDTTFRKLDEDAYDYFLSAGSFERAAKKGGVAKLPTGKAFLAHPAYDGFWQAMAVQPRLTAVEVPTLEVGGWWDQEDMWGTQAEYAALKPHDAQHQVFMVLGPWNHGEWAQTTRHLGALDFGSATTDSFRRNIEAPFFARYLKDEKGFDLKDTATFQTGSNHWMRYAVWPPKQEIANRQLYLAKNGGLSFQRPHDAAASTSYVSDPANPVPYRHRPIQATYAPGSKWRPWLVEDQRFVTSRPDVATWTTPALDHGLTVTGDVMADIFAATTGSDVDWIVKLIDVYPDGTSADATAQEKMAGFQLMIADEIFRGRYRKSFEHPHAIQPNAVDEYKWSLHGVDHVFLKGHRIMVEAQSTWFPLYDRNPQTYVKNIMTAPEKSYKPETETIYESTQYPSHLDLPVAER
ncbi:MAG: CocE/NonD family hydrolase [Acidobacteriaceae bacterium]